MKKFLCLVVALAVILSITACGTNGWKSSVTDYAGEVSSNGGFAVVKGDYVYFINGVESNTATNDFGKPVKGALVRAKLSELGNENTKCEIVVPKLVFSNAAEGSNGFYIYGDYVYYTSPCDNKDKTGAVMNTSLDFIRTKLDGSNTTTITTVSSLSTPYRYVESGDKVYLVMYTTDSEGNNVLKSFDASKKESVVATSGAVKSYLFADNLAQDYCYYVETAHDEELDEDESFQNIVKFSFTGGEKAVVLKGDDGTQGATFALIKNTNDGNLYFSKTYVDTTVATTVRYYVANTSFELTLLSEATSDASTIFAATSYYSAPDAIVYFNSSLGFLRYNYNNKNDNKTFGVEYLVSDREVLSTLSSLSVSAYTDEYVYMTDSSNCYYRIKTAELLAGNCKVEQITYVAISTSSTFYKPEFIGNYIMGAVSTEPFGNYIYAVELVTTELSEEEKEAKVETYDFTEKANVEAFRKLLVGVVTDADAETYSKYLEKTFKDED